ncbi:hypothetical protein D869_gp253 [Caulobacter phage CcrRogue]|uniref:Uncharacterized protein n=1 Tax=Caulobacter phage CcrRogue TaxID=2927986 RepID=K4JNS7_9CAUD|nr:hypothetical protein D869_gp253 [Caulobacter phage CcrRogue]AFU86661.1 hypothetical protein CcrRogue_gp179 [Caulobacter phage CcrRogue]
MHPLEDADGALKIADLERKLAEANEALDDYAKEAVDLRATIRRLEGRCREYESYENDVAKRLLRAGAPSAVVPLTRVEWAERRITESRPITDERVRRLLIVLDNADAYRASGILPDMWHGIRRDIIDILSAGAHIGRDEGPYHAARKIADNSRSDNIIGTWFYSGADGCWRVRQEVLVTAIVEAIEEQVAIATVKKTDLLSEVSLAFKAGGVDCGDLLARIDAILKGPTS